MNVLRLAFVAVFIGAFMSSFGLSGAVLVTLIGTMVVKLLGAARVAALMHVPIWEALPWGRLTAITARAGVAAIPVWWLSNHLTLAPLLILFLGGAVYATAYFGMAYVAILAPRKRAPYNLESAAPHDLVSAAPDESIARAFTARLKAAP
jgi:O-antigen/teichoic acid export membrane protein